MKNYTKVNLTSSNLSEEKQVELRHILPEAFSENKIDWEKLRLVLGESALEHIEKFSFSWAGKSDAIKNVLIPSKGTLRADKDESIKFDESENLFIEGDNLEVLKLLQKAYFEKVKMIYIDPPYNTGGDFVYRDNFTAPLKGYMEQTGQVDSEGNKLRTNKETNGRFHSDWLSMMYPRLKLAWNLLKDDGVIFVSIDDNEAHRLRMIMDEVFGEENYVSIFPWRKRTAKSDVPFGVSQDYEWILCYTRGGFNAGVGYDRRYYQTDDFPNNRWRLSDLTTQRTSAERKNSAFDMIDPKTGKAYPFNRKRVWGVTKDTFQEYYDKGKIVFPDDYDFLNITVPAYRVFEGEDKERALKKYGVENAMKSVSTLLPKEVGMSEDGNKEMVELFNGKIFPFSKPKELLQYLMTITNDKNESIILDFFAGSGTTAHAVLKQNQEDGGNRKFILVQLPEATDEKSEAYKAGYKNIADISKERIRRVINGYGDTPQPIDDGFKVFKLGASNYRENQFEFDPEKSEEENKKAFEDYLAKAKQALLFDEVNVSDIIYENIVKEGFSLNAGIMESKIDENTVYTVSDGEMQFLICLDRKVGDETVRALTGADYKGKTVICFDNALDDTAKANLGLNVELKTI